MNNADILLNALFEYIEAAKHDGSQAHEICEEIQDKIIEHFQLLNIE